MQGTKHISDLITSPEALKAGRINIIEAGVSSGKTTFALTTLPQWTGNPERILYLIDTTNGELHIQRNIISVNRMDYSLYEYGKERAWGESNSSVRNKMPVMTYAGFAAEMRSSEPFPWERFDYIVCDEMQNLVRYQNYEGGNGGIIAAEQKLRDIAAEGRIKIIALSATPQKIRKHFGALCYDVPFDRSELSRLETTQVIPYACGAMDLLKSGTPPAVNHQTGILYTTEIASMRKIIEDARALGIRANGFWSINAKGNPMSEEQLALRRVVLEEETIPADIDLLVINAASETCIKIQSEKRKVDYMIIHSSSEEVKTQVRGRYHGDLPALYYHDIGAANLSSCRNLPSRFLNVRLYAEGQKELTAYLKLQNPKAAEGSYFQMRKVRELLEASGYSVDYKKDSKNGGKHYYLIH